MADLEIRLAAGLVPSQPRQRKGRLSMFRTVVLFALALAIATFALAQTTTTDALAGMLTDSSVAVVPAAPATIKDVNTRETRTVPSNASAAYRFKFRTPH